MVKYYSRYARVEEVPKLTDNVILICKVYLKGYEHKALGIYIGQNGPVILTETLRDCDEVCNYLQEEFGTANISQILAKLYAGSSKIHKHHARIIQETDS